ncbi:MAG: MutS-related protein [Actinomycetes bacterium]
MVTTAFGAVRPSVLYPGPVAADGTSQTPAADGVGSGVGSGVGTETPRSETESEAAETLRDLNLDQLIDSIIDGWQPYELVDLFRQRLSSVDTVEYRQEVFADLGSPAVLEPVEHFTRQMRDMRISLARAGEMFSDVQRQRWVLDAILRYVAAVQELADGLGSAPVRSRGVRSVAAFLSGYVASAPFTTLAEQATEIERELAAITYCVQVAGSRVWVSLYGGQQDYAAEVLETFARFRQAPARSYLVEWRTWPHLDHVESGVVERVQRLTPEPFARLARFVEEQRGYLDPVLAAFEREIQFYVAYLHFLRPLRAAGVSFCTPRVTEAPGELRVTRTVDLALASALVARGAGVVTNDVRLLGAERIIVVTGPNQAGKTTFARTFGQLHHLAALGCPVPGEEARIPLCDRVFTHFIRQDALGQVSGTLEDEVIRIYGVLRHATARSVIVANEMFGSTSLSDAVMLGTDVLRRILGIGAAGVCVTFIDELAGLDERIVSMASTVRPEDPTQRTFQVVRRPADGLAYAVAIADRYGLSYERVRVRVADRCAEVAS